MKSKKTAVARSRVRASVRFSVEERTLRMLEAANKLFLEKGYADTSLNDVIRIAGGSKATIIEQFRNKAGLFAAVIDNAANEFTAKLSPIDDSGGVRHTLQGLGEAVLRFYLTPTALVAYRAAMSEGSKHPELSRAFYMRYHEYIIKPIAEQLQRWHDQHLLAAADFNAEAERFTHMLLVRSGYGWVTPEKRIPR